MRNLEKYLKNKKIDYKKCLKYGFIKENDMYIYNKNILNDKFNINITFSDREWISKLIDLEFDEEYTLVDVESAVGEFIGLVKEEYEKIIKEVIRNCTALNVFKNKQTLEVIEYIAKKYNDNLEFLWEKFDNNAIWRNKKNNKWYGLILTIPENKLGFDSNGKIEIIDLRYEKDKVYEVVDNVNIFKGYHMNKNSWITIKLDYTFDNDYLFNLIDNSYNLSLKK